LIDNAAAATKLGRFEQVLGVIVGVIQVEEKVPEASGVRRQYGIAMRRFDTKPVLEGLSRLLGAPKHRAAAVTAVQRGGAAGGEGLMDVPAAAPTAGARRAGCGAGGGRGGGGVRRVEADDRGNRPARPYAGPFRVVRRAQRPGAHRRAG